MKLHRYTPEQLAFLREGYRSLTAAKLTVAFNERFGAALSVSSIKTALSRHGIRCDRRGAFNKGQSKYSDEQIAYLRTIAPSRTFKEIVAAFNGRFGLGLTSGQIRYIMDHNNISSGKFGQGKGAHGHTPWNKGMNGKMPRNAGHFSEGERPVNAKPLGAVRRVDGRIQVKTEQGWRFKHIVIWEQANGPVPPGHKILFKDGDYNNICLDNLELVNAHENFRIAHTGFHHAPEGLRPPLLTLGRLVAKISERSKEVQS